MLIRANVKFNCEENAENLIQAFFTKEAFNPKSRLIINGKECNLEIFFEKTPPFDLMKEISYCDIISFTFNEENDISEDDNCVSKEASIISDLPKKVNEAVASSAIPKKTKSKLVTEETLEVSSSSKKAIEGDIPEEVKKIIRENKDITTLCHEMAVFFKMNSYESFFENYLKEAFYLKESEITLKNITNLLNKKGIQEPANGLQNTLSQKISKIMQNYNLPRMGLKTFIIFIINYYNEYWKTFCNEEKSAECKEEENNVNTLVLKDLPENAEFNETMSKMPKDLTEIEKVKYVFRALHSEIDDEWANELVQILKHNVENFDSMLGYEQRAKVATDISNIWQNVKVNEFLTSIKKIICN